MQSLTRRRRARVAARGSFLLAVAALCALVTALVVTPYLAGDAGASPLVRRAGGTGAAVAFLLVAVIIDLGVAVVYLPLLRHNRAYFRRLTRAGGGYDPVALALFIGALEAVARKAGVKGPDIAVLDLPVANALAFERGGRPVIGLTTGLLEAELSVGEAEAIMADELADVVTADFLRRPTVKAFEPAAYALLGLFAALGLFASPMVSVGRGVWWGVGFLAIVVGLLLVGGFLLRRLGSGRSRDYALADRFAAGNVEPGALAGAIRKLDAMSNGSPRLPFPENEMALDRFFTPVYCFTDTPESFVRRRQGELGMKGREQLTERQVEGVRRAMEERRRRGEELVAARLSRLGPGIPA